MSRIGKMPITIPEGVKVTREGDVVIVEKDKLRLTQGLLPGIEMDVEGNELRLTRVSEDRKLRALHGLTRSLINNMVIGVSTGFSKELKIEGLGYRAAKEGNALVLTVGLSHKVEMPEPEGITIEVPKPTQIIVKGADKQMVGETAAKIRAVRPPEPYKGKGIRYVDEQVRLRVGKTGAK